MSDSDSAAANELMTVTTERRGSTMIVTVVGELDLHTARDLMSAVDDVLAEPALNGVVIDLSDVSFLGSSGLGTLAELATRAPAARRPGDSPVPVRLVSKPDNRAVIRPWETMNLQQILPLHADVATALAGLT